MGSLFFIPFIDYAMPCNALRSVIESMGLYVCCMLFFNEQTILTYMKKVLEL